MHINKILYVLGDIETDKLISLMKVDKCGWEYFVYTTSGLPVIGNFNEMKLEKNEVTVLGVASSRRLAKKLVLYIVTKALELDADIASGIKKIADISDI